MEENKIGFKGRMNKKKQNYKGRKEGIKLKVTQIERKIKLSKG